MVMAIQNKIGWGIAGALALLLVASFAGVVRGGPLDPTSPPGSTMKTLQEVEPRTPISSLPYTISQPGSYYLTGNLAGIPGSNGITIAADDVTVDLNGFTLRGGAGSADGISVVSWVDNVSIVNGTVRDWGGNGLNSSFAGNGRVADLRALSNGGVGIRWSGSTAVDGCDASFNGGRGIETWASIVTRCTASGNGSDGIWTGGYGTVSDCVANSNAGDGVRVAIRGVVSGCRASLNGGNGFEIGPQTRVVGNSSVGNDGAGVHVTGSGSHLEGNNVTQNAIGFDVDFAGNLLIRNSADANVTNYDIASGNNVGPIVTSSTIATDSNPHSNYGYY